MTNPRFYHHPAYNDHSQRLPHTWPRGRRPLGTARTPSRVPPGVAPGVPPTGCVLVGYPYGHCGLPDKVQLLGRLPLPPSSRVSPQKKTLFWSCKLGSKYKVACHQRHVDQRRRFSFELCPPGPQKVSDPYSQVQNKIVVQSSSFAHSKALGKRNRL